MKLSSSIRRKARGEQGYVLLMLLLIVALMAIFAMAALTEFKFEMRRDQEEEMIHRGVQYARAVQFYYKKFGSYPTRMEALENTNGIRFLRQRYKDPLNCKKGKCEDFKLLHFGEVQLAGSMGMNPGIPGASSIGQGNGGLNGPGGFGGNTIGGNSSPFGQNGFGQNGPGQSGFGQNAPGQNNQDPSQNNPTAGTDASQSDSQNGSNSNSSSGFGSNNGTNGQQFGGAAIVGVASLVKKDTVRIYNNKKKYNEWQFVYDPATQRQGIVTTPYQPLTALGTPAQNINNQIHGPGSTPSTGGFVETGQPPPGMLNDPDLNRTPPPPSSNPPQQQ